MSQFRGVSADEARGVGRKAVALGAESKAMAWCHYIAPKSWQCQACVCFPWEKLCSALLLYTESSWGGPCGGGQGKGGAVGTQIISSRRM
eukprot:356410-Chlamydomonas_euryale.AAC.2